MLAHTEGYCASGEAAASASERRARIYGYEWRRHVESIATPVISEPDPWLIAPSIRRCHWWLDSPIGERKESRRGWLTAHRVVH